MVLRLSNQLEMLGFDETVRRAEADAKTDAERRRMVRRIEVAHELMSELPPKDELSFLHSGLCQTGLPHSRPANNHDIWTRRSGRFSLLIQPGAIDTETGPQYVGVPYGPKARLILIHLQTEGLKSRKVNLGSSFSAFMRSMGLAVTGGKRGSIGAVREQSLRIAQCSFTMQWTESESAGDRTVIANSRIVDQFEFWRASGEWHEIVELSERFHAHLCEHAVPLDKRGIAHLAANSLGLDLYALFAYRLPRLDRPVHLRWAMLQAQMGSNEKTLKSLGQRIREVMPDVLTAYPHANVEVTAHGLMLKPSKAAVPHTNVRGFRVVAE